MYNLLHAQKWPLLSYIFSVICGSTECDCSSDTLSGRIDVYFNRPPSTSSRKTKTLAFISLNLLDSTAVNKTDILYVLFPFGGNILKTLPKIFYRRYSWRFCVTGQSPFLLKQSPLVCLWSFLFYSQCKLWHTRKLGLV